MPGVIKGGTICGQDPVQGLGIPRRCPFYEGAFGLRLALTATHKNASGGLLFDFLARVAITLTLVFPDTGATEWTFSAFVTGFEPDMPVDGELGAAVTFKPTGDMTLV